jgi:hypothetical protein
MSKLVHSIAIILLLLSMNDAVAQTGKRPPKEDSLVFLLPQLAFDSTENTNRYVHPSGFTVRYTYKWNRDYSLSDELYLQLRNPNPNYPATFRETVSVIREVSEDSSKTLEEMAAFYARLSADTWEQYRITYAVKDSGEVMVNGKKMYYLRVGLNQLSQEKLIVIVQRVNQFFIMEYTATDKTFAFFLEDFWKMIHSCAFIER